MKNSGLCNREAHLLCLPSFTCSCLGLHECCYLLPNPREQSGDHLEQKAVPWWSLLQQLGGPNSTLLPTAAAVMECSADIRTNKQTRQ